MNNAYVDASVILRVVVDEPGQLREWDALEAPVTSALAEVEALRTIDRAMRRATHPRRLGENAANAARALLFQTLEMFVRVDLAPAIVTRAGQLAGPLGTLTHDPELAVAAAAHGLTVIGELQR